MDKKTEAILTVSYHPPWQHVLALLLIGASLFMATVYLVAGDGIGAVQYIGILGLLGAICFALGALMTGYLLFTPKRFWIYQDRIAYHGLLNFRLVEVFFEELDHFEAEYLGRKLNILYLKRKKGRKRTVYPAWFTSDKDWLAVLGEIRKRAPLR